MKENMNIKDIIECTKLVRFGMSVCHKTFLLVDVLHWCVKRSSLPLKSGILLSVLDSLGFGGLPGLVV